MSDIICGFIGLGLIGGSIARALKNARPCAKIIACDPCAETLRLAREQHIVDAAVPVVNEAFSECNYIFLCAPVQKNDGNLSAVKKVMSPGCLLTDVGSVKTAIHQAVNEAGLDHCFVGGHPMAGSERTGFANSKISLLENAFYILTPTPEVPSGKLEDLRTLVEEIGAIPLVLDHKKHDYITAAISHLPHVVAASLVNLIRDSDSPDGLMKMVAAGGFKDITRIASSSALMWQQICLTNTENISALLEDYIRSLKAVKAQLDQRSEQGLFEFFEGSRIYRDSFVNAPSGPIKSSCSINVEIADKTGSLAHIATLLADHNVSIKNIGITHNRESEDGVLRVEFYDEASRDVSVSLLEKKGYAVQIR